MIPEAKPSCPSGVASNPGEPEECDPDRQVQPASALPACNALNYHLDDQIGYLLRLANQRHLEIFNNELPELTPTQLALLARLLEEDDISQNELGRRIGIDAATTNGVIDRLSRKKLVQTRTDLYDKRRLRVVLTPAGRRAIHEAIPVARRITQLTLQALSPEETEQLVCLLQKLQVPA